LQILADEPIGRTELTESAFANASEAWGRLPETVRTNMHGILNGSRPLAEFEALPVEQQSMILDYYAATGARAAGSNPTAVFQLNRARIQFLVGERSTPPAGISNLPESNYR